MKKVLMKLITAIATLEHFGIKECSNPQWYVIEAIKDINNAIEELTRRHGKLD